MKKYLIFSVIVFISLQSMADTSKLVPAYKVESSWNKFEASLKREQKSDYIRGLSYLISGGVGTIAGMIGYNNTSDPLAKGVFALTQTLGIAAAGSGAYSLYIGSNDNIFAKTVYAANLTDTQRDQMTKAYLEQKKEIEKRTNTIRAITHGAIAAVNAYTGLAETNSSLRSALFIVAGINALASLSYTF